MASGSTWLTGEDKQQDDGCRDCEQAGGGREVTNGRSTAIDDTTSRVEQRPPTKGTHDHERAERPPPRPGPMHEKPGPEKTDPTSSNGDANNERRNENSFELIPGAGVKRDPERRDADSGGEERQSRGQHHSAATLPGHATQIARSAARPLGQSATVAGSVAGRRTGHTAGPKQVRRGRARNRRPQITAHGVGHCCGSQAADAGGALAALLPRLLPPCPLTRMATESYGVSERCPSPPAGARCALTWRCGRKRTRTPDLTRDQRVQPRLLRLPCRRRNADSLAGCGVGMPIALVGMPIGSSRSPCGGALDGLGRAIAAVGMPVTDAVGAVAPGCLDHPLAPPPRGPVEAAAQLGSRQRRSGGQAVEVRPTGCGLELGCRRRAVDRGRRHHDHPGPMLDSLLDRGDPKPPIWSQQTPTGEQATSC